MASQLKLPLKWVLLGWLAILGSLVAGVCIGPVTIAPISTLSVIADHLPFIDIAHGLSGTQEAIIWQLRLPRVVLAFLVGAMLSSAGTAYQGTFRNPLADPYLLGVSAGAGLGATLAIVSWHSAPKLILPAAAFVGALGAVLLTYSLGRSAIVGRSSTALVLAGVAVASLLAALQTLLQQRNVEKVREIYSWTLGRLAVSGWAEVQLALPYILICIAVIHRYRRVLDVFAVGDEEAQALGLPVRKARAILIGAASFGTAAAVSVSGLIGFVGIIVPHAIRMIAGSSYRMLVPLSAIYGGVFLVLADIVARVALAPEEIPIGVITALLGAPFFLYVLGARNRDLV